ncbi:two-component system response regulator YesN [Paenibacillus phyllosphaerae]|uniref:Two-component system response regulator YesN n=1 Tax=Paenibacillus phyllosphaerae TaxID=274593 RepID=A0A7W5AU21_9BACL|nr:response regulator [Paenibacillus phyllosphaerae]MBB3108783.1 two-component system response regulator YesN [Paenibacillus phyllosphaerae]
MLRLLIVEDERWEREGLVEFWDWQQFGITRIDTAVDGIDGLEKALAVSPDIIITDIRMPGMDGIEMSKQIREQLPDVRIIVLTGYDDFRFAREAIRFNAADYVLKPVEDEELRRTIAKVAAECKVLLEQRSASPEAANKRREAEDMLTDLLQGTGDPDSIWQELATVFGDNAAYLAAVILPLLPVDPELPSTIHRSAYVLPCKELEEAGVFIAPLQQEENVEVLEQRLRVTLAESAILVSSGQATLAELPDRYREAVGTARHARFYGRSGMIDAAEEALAKHAFAPRAAEVTRSCQELVREIRVQGAAGKPDKVTQLLDELFAKFRSEPGAGQAFPATMLNVLLTELTLLSGEHELPEAVRSNRLLAYDSLKQLEEAVRRYMSEWMARLEEKRTNKDESVIRKVTQIVEAQYGSNELSLTMLAEAVFLSVNHLGVVFKKAMGKTVHEYITAVRMAKAEEQLRMSKRKVAAIASEVGIPNTSYFCSLFKQAYGMTPGEYQEMMQRR